MTNLRKGGGIQVGLSIIEAYNSLSLEFNFIAFCSTSLYQRIPIEVFENNKITIIKLDIILVNPLSVLKGIYKLSKFEQMYNTIGCITIFGPTLYRPNCKHLVGFAQGHLIYPDSPYWSNTSIFVKLIFRIKSFIFKYLFSYSSDVYHVESDFAKINLSKYLKVDIDKIIVANNYPHIIFDKHHNYFKRLYFNYDDSFIFVVPCAYYPHKNLEIINKIIEYLNFNNFVVKIKFILTLDQDIFEKKFIKSEMIVNIGPVSGLDLINLYNNSNALFLPTLLELFPGNYLECMKLGKPILTSDLPFARDICKDAALYFNPLRADLIYKNIKDFIADKNMQNTLILNGFAQIKQFQSSIERATTLINKLKNND
jgi:hypothetical protein